MNVENFVGIFVISSRYRATQKRQSTYWLISIRSIDWCGWLLRAVHFFRDNQEFSIIMVNCRVEFGSKIRAHVARFFSKIRRPDKLAGLHSEQVPLKPMSSQFKECAAHIDRFRPRDLLNWLWFWAAVSMNNSSDQLATSNQDQNPDTQQSDWSVSANQAKCSHFKLIHS